MTIETYGDHGEDHDHPAYGDYDPYAQVDELPTEKEITDWAIHDDHASDQGQGLSPEEAEALEQEDPHDTAPYYDQEYLDGERADREDHLPEEADQDEDEDKDRDDGDSLTTLDQLLLRLDVLERAVRLLLEIELPRQDERFAVAVIDPLTANRLEILHYELALKDEEAPHANA